MAHPLFARFLLLLYRLMAEMDVVLYCDFHGHNRKNNVFMYGCNNRGDASLKLRERLFPLMMSKNAGDKVRNCFSNTLCNIYVVRVTLGLYLYHDTMVISINKNYNVSLFNISLTS